MLFVNVLLDTDISFHKLGRKDYLDVLTFLVHKGDKFFGKQINKVKRNL